MNEKPRTMKMLASVLFALLAAASARAAVPTLGGLGSSVEFSASGFTYVDLTRSASEAGSYSSATIYWTGADSLCSGTGSFMLKFYRPDAATGESLAFLAERGPFNASDGFVNVALSPAVTLQAGDVVGVTELVSGDCGAIAMITGGGNQTLCFVGDSGTSSITICDQTEATLIPQMIGVVVRGQGTQNRAGVILGAGSVQGAAGSNFRTSMQLANPGDLPIQGQLVFHPAGVAASANDPAAGYAIGPNQAINFADVVASIGGSGLGSIDVLASSSYAPLVVTRIFNDGGAAGTAGFSEPLVRSGDEYVIEAPKTAWLIAPQDLSKFRMNVAIRSLDEGATLQISLTDSNGSSVASATRTLPANEFDLESTSQLFPGVQVGDNDTIQVKVVAGKAIIGGVVVDNTTNDTSLQLATRTHF